MKVLNILDTDRDSKSMANFCHILRIYKKLWPNSILQNNEQLILDVFERKFEIRTPPLGFKKEHFQTNLRIELKFSILIDWFTWIENFV